MFSTGVALVTLRNKLLSADVLSCLSFVLLFLPVMVSRCGGCGSQSLFPMPYSWKQQSAAEGSCPALCFKLPRLPMRSQAATKPERNRKGSEIYWIRHSCSLPEEYFEKLSAHRPYQEHRIFIAQALCLDARENVQNGLLSHLLGLMPQ